jgi:hypothetical protein
MDSGLKLISNSLSKFPFFLARDLVVLPAINIVGYFSILLSLFIDSYISIVKSNAGLLFVVFCSGSSITSGDNSYIIGVSIGLIG